MLQFGLIGYPLDHSFSERYFNQKFNAEEIDAHYRNFPITDLNALHQLIEKHHLSGFNVTIPFKERIIPLLDEIDEQARMVGAVNCVKIKDQKLKGYNTDIIGFERSFLDTLPKNKKYKALIFGSGGSSKAVVYCLQRHHIPYQIVSRNEYQHTITYRDIDQQLLQHYHLLINTTPLGMYPDMNEKVPLSYQHITQDHIAFDLVYNPAKTAFLLACEEQGAAILNGLEMLHIQADEAFRLFMETS